VIFAGQNDIFVTGTDGLMYEDTVSLSNGSSSGFYQVGPSSEDFTSGPSPVAETSTAVDVFATGTSSNIYGLHYSGGSGWSGPNLIGSSSSQTYYTPSAIVFANQEDVFVSGTDGLLYVDVQTLPGGGWTGFYAAPSPQREGFSTSPSAVSPASTELDVLGSVNNGVYRVSYVGE
jgi:hypothetical protein